MRTVHVQTLVATLALLASLPATAAGLTLNFSGSLDSVYLSSTRSSFPPSLGTVLGGSYTGVLVYDPTSGAVSSGQLRFGAGYGVNNYNSSTAPLFTQSQWTWGDVTYALSGTVTSGSTATLVIGGVLDPLTQTASSPAVDALGTSNLVPAIAGSPPVCTSRDPTRQSINCFEPPANVFGLDALVLAFAGGAHTLAFDEIIDFCGPANPCSTSWFHFAGAGSAVVVPVPAAGLLFAPALLLLGAVRRRH